MYFNTENLSAVTDRDLSLHHEACCILKALLFVKSKQTEKNRNWKASPTDCHVICRLLRMFFKELVLVDGALIGLELVKECDGVTVVCTNHSWLRTPDGAIIDPYPMGVLAAKSALLVPTSDTVYVIHGSNFYRADRSLMRGFNPAESWKRARSHLRAIKKNLKKEDFSKIRAGIL